MRSIASDSTAFDFEDLLTDLRDLPPSRRAIYARIHLAQTWLSASDPPLDSTVDRAEIAQILAQSVRQARSLADPRAEAYALGQLGQVYESNRQWEDARQLTQQAITLAQSMGATDITARWQWQLGRVLTQQGKQTAAIDAYDNAIESLQGLRQDLAAIAPEARFSFRDSVEPVYRQYIDLLLTRDPASGQVPQANLEKAREAVEALQLAEIDNFFREACLDAQPVPIDEIDAKAAAIYPIILEDRLAVILSLPGQPLYYDETPIPEAEVNATLEGLVQYLNPVFPESRRMPLSQTLYDWLIRPLEAQLADREPQTLVFVLDGLLRNLPMGVLHDGEQYLIEKYGVAIAPSLRLLKTENTAPTAEQPALMAGLSEARQGYVALPGVKEEVEKISQVLSGEVLLNSQFTENQLQQRINAEPFSVLHLATHGQFSSNAEETYLVTWDGRIEVKELDSLLRSRETGNRVPIDLLVLSACQTAAGDRQAALGLAGFAVRSGARSTLATLWSVGDRSTARLMTEFYAQLRNNPRLSKAEALRQAQLKLLRSSDYNHPFYWSPFVLVGNWL
jgi:CHAT domain-containing protein